jgi:hypothetical protein
MPRAAAAAAAVAVAAKYVAMHTYSSGGHNSGPWSHRGENRSVDCDRSRSPHGYRSSFHGFIVTYISSARLEDYRFTSCTMFRVEVLFRSDYSGIKACSESFEMVQ